MFPYNIEVSTKKTVDGKSQFVAVGEVTIFYPSLDDLGIVAAVKPAAVDAEGKAANQGLPEYADEKLQFVFDAICAAVKADARNKLITGTCELREGAKIAETLEELLAVAERDGTALKLFREMLTAFKAWLPTTGKSEKVQAAILQLASNKKAITLQSEVNKGKLEAYITQFAASLAAAKAVEFTRPLSGIVEACQAVDVLDDM